MKSPYQRKGVVFTIPICVAEEKQAKYSRLILVFFEGTSGLDINGTKSHILSH